MISLITLLLILITTLAGLVGFLKEISSKYKKLFASLILLFAIAAGILNYYKEKDTSEKHALEFDTTLSKLNTTDKKISLAIDTLNFLLSKTNKVLDKNDTILTKQDITYSATDRIINPLFPITVEVHTKISFEDTLTRFLNGYMYELRAKIEKGDTSIHIEGLSYGSKQRDGHINDISFSNFDAIKNDLSLAYEIFYFKYYYLTIIKADIKSIPDILKPFLRSRAIISEDSRSIFELSVNFENREYRIHEIFHNIDIVTESPLKNETILGFNDLLNSTVLLHTYKNKSINYIQMFNFYSESGLKKGCFIDLQLKKRQIARSVIMNGSPARMKDEIYFPIFLHKIDKSDLTMHNFLSY